MIGNSKGFTHFLVASVVVACLGYVDIAVAVPTVYEEWRVEEKINPSGDELIVYAYVQARPAGEEKREETFLIIECRDGKLRPSLTHARFLGANNIYISVELAVDGNDAVRFLARTFSNSTKSAFVPFTVTNSAAGVDQHSKIESLLEQMLEGESLSMEVNAGSSRAAKASMDLAGFNDAHQRVKGFCDAS